MSGGHWLCGHPILAEPYREGDCYHCVSVHSSNPAWTAKGKEASRCATSHMLFPTQSLLPVCTAICLHVPLCLPWQLPPSPRCHTTNIADLLKHLWSRSWASNVLLMTCQEECRTGKQGRAMAYMGRRRGCRCEPAQPSPAHLGGERGPMVCHEA